MKNPTKQEQKDEAWKAYRVIRDPAYKAYEAIIDPAEKTHLAIRYSARKAYQAIRDSAWIAYEAKVEEINAIDLQDLLKKYGIQHGLENDQSNIDGFIVEVKKLIREGKL